MQSKVTAIVVVAAIIIAAGGLYITQLSSELTSIRQEVAAATAKTQQCNASVEQVQKNLTSTTTDRDLLQGQLKDSAAKLETVSNDLGKQVADLQRQVARLKAGAAWTGKVAGYWRDLFDYTTPSSMKSASNAKN